MHFIQGFIMNSKIELNINDMKEIVLILQNYEINNGVDFPNRLKDEMFKIEIEYQSFHNFDENDFGIEHEKGIKA